MESAGAFPPSRWGLSGADTRAGALGATAPSARGSELGRSVSETRSARAQSQSQGPRWGGRGWGGGAFLQPPQLAGPALRLEGRLTVRARTQTRAWASKLSSTEAQVGVGGHTQRGHRTPGALFWSCWLSTDPTTLRFALNNPVGPPGQQQGLCRRPGEGGVGT